jgi:hypothetical protein
MFLSAWRPSKKAFSKNGKPEIFNTYQGSQFTSKTFTGLLKKKASESAWTTVVVGAITSSSNGCGDHSSTKRSTCMPTPRSPRLDAALVDT